MMLKFISKIIRRRSQPEHIRAGKWGEAIAVKFLKKKGYRILGRRVRFDRKYEIDIVAREIDTLVFIEVKTRRSEAFGRPIDAVNRKKREMLQKAAIKYMRKIRKLPHYIRFDVVEIVGSPAISHPSIQHIENAFTLNPRYRLPFKPS